MELPSLSPYFFSASPEKERVCRWVCSLLVTGIVLVLFLCWDPLRSSVFTYSLVSITINNAVVFTFFQVVTVFGSEGFFLVLFAVIYWSVNKTLGFWGLIVMPLSIFITSEIPKDIIRLPRPDVRGVLAPTYTFPSGHTSGAVSVWGYLAIVLKKRWVWIWALIITFLVGLSRIVLGYHFPGDVLGGIVMGIIFLALCFGLAFRVVEKGFVIKLTFGILLCLVFAVPFAMSFLPAIYAPNLMGYLTGAGVGYLFERKNLNFFIRGNWQQHFARSMIGLPVIAVIIPGLGTVLPYNIHLLTFIQHALATFWITYLAPLAFKKMNLAS